MFLTPNVCLYLYFWTISKFKVGFSLFSGTKCKHCGGYLTSTYWDPCHIGYCKLYFKFITKTEKNEFQCKFCCEQYLDKMAIFKHIRTNHTETNKDLRNSKYIKFKNPSKCDICGDENISNLHWHLKSCEIYSKFVSQEILENGQFSMKCLICSVEERCLADQNLDDRKHQGPKYLVRRRIFKHVKTIHTTLLRCKIICPKS